MTRPCACWPTRFTGFWRPSARCAPLGAPGAEVWTGRSRVGWNRYRSRAEKIERPLTNLRCAGLGPSFHWGVKTEWRGTALLVLAIGVVGALAWPVSTHAARPSTHPAGASGESDAADAESHPILFNDEEIVRLSAPHKGEPAAVRAASASRALETALHKPEGAVEARVSESTAVIYVGGRAIFELGVGDSEAAGRPSLRVFAGEVADSVRRAAAGERKRRAIAERVLGVSGVVFLGFLAWMLIGVAGQVAERATRWLEGDARNIGSLRLKRIELLPASAVREGLRLGVFSGLWLTRLGLFYTWLLAVLSLFPATRPWAAVATGFLFAPALDLVGRIASRLPLLLAVVLSLLTVLLVVRFISLYARGIERREIKNVWVRPETARTTGTLLSVGLGLGSLLFITPLLSGSGDGSLPRLGLLGFLAIALGATPLIASCLLGVRMVYGRLWNLGDRAEYGGEKGEIASIGLLDVCLQGEDGAIVRVPHLMSLWKPTRIYPKTASPADPTQSDPDES